MRTKLEVLHDLREIENEMIEDGRQLDVYLARNEGSNVYLAWTDTDANLTKRDALWRELKRIEAGVAA